MKRGLLLGGTAVISSVGALLYQAGSWMPTFLVGQTTDGLGNSQQSQGSRTLTGDPVQTHYGNVQVEISVTGAHIDSVNVLQAPSGRNQQWTAHAIPILVQETLAAQSADISSVTGVSWTSEGFIKSLQSALSQM